MTLERLQERHPSHFTITSKNPMAFGGSLRTSLFTMTKKSIPEKILDTDAKPAVLSRKEKKNLIKDLQVQLKDLQAINQLYREQLEHQRSAKTQQVNPNQAFMNKTITTTKYSDPN